jgi:spermidine synthase
MGATLPVLVGHFERNLVGPALAHLYSLNTLGAVAGSIVSGFLLLPSIGLAATTWVAAGLNTLVAAVAWRASRAPNPGSSAAETPIATPVLMPAGALSGGSRFVFAVLFALSGFAALAFQIAWVRLFSLVLGSSVYSFSAVLGVYLLGLALGSAVVAGFMRRGVSLTGFATLQLALAMICALELNLFATLPDTLYELAGRAGANWSALFIAEIMLVAMLLIVPCALLGAVFPVATRLLQREDGGHAAGFAYAVNTLGTIAGSP